jgi:carbonic anhydrase
VFDAGPGELFVVRNIAGLVPVYEPDLGDHGVSAALEYAVLALAVRHVIVRGHGMCGGSEAALDLSGPLRGRTSSRPGAGVRELAAELDLEALPDPAVRRRTLAPLDRALDRELRPCWTTRVRDGSLDLHGAWFDTLGRSTRCHPTAGSRSADRRRTLRPHEPAWP